MSRYPHSSFARKKRCRCCVASVPSLRGDGSGRYLRCVNLLPLEPPCSLPWTTVLPHWFTLLGLTPPSSLLPWTALLPPFSSPGPHSSLLVHSLDRTAPSSLLTPGSLPWAPTPPSWFTPLGHTPPSWGLGSFCCACANTIRLSGSSRAVAAQAAVALVQRTAGMQLPPYCEASSIVVGVGSWVGRGSHRMRQEPPLSLCQNFSARHGGSCL